MQERQGAEREVQCLLKIGILARDRYSTLSVCSHQVMISSREKSESPRNQISTSGQRSRTRFTIRLISSSAPLAGRLSAVRNRAQSRKSPQKRYSGRSQYSR